MGAKKEKKSIKLNQKFAVTESVSKKSKKNLTDFKNIDKSVFKDRKRILNEKKKQKRHKNIKELAIKNWVVEEIENNGTTIKSKHSEINEIVAHNEETFNNSNNKKPKFDANLTHNEESFSSNKKKPKFDANLTQNEQFFSPNKKSKFDANPTQNEESFSSSIKKKPKFDANISQNEQSFSSNKKKPKINANLTHNEQSFSSNKNKPKFDANLTQTEQLFSSNKKKAKFNAHLTQNEQSFSSNKKKSKINANLTENEQSFIGSIKKKPEINESTPIDSNKRKPEINENVTQKETSFSSNNNKFQNTQYLMDEDDPDNPSDLLLPNRLLTKNGQVPVIDLLSENESDLDSTLDEESDAVLYDEDGKPLDLDAMTSTLDFKPSPVHQATNLSLLAVDDKIKRKLLAKGIVIKTGTWGKEEDSILQRNLAEFGKKHRLKNPYLLLGMNSKKPNTVKFTTATHFYAYLGKDLNNRTLTSIYRRARKINSIHFDNDGEVLYDIEDNPIDLVAAGASPLDFVPSEVHRITNLNVANLNCTMKEKLADSGIKLQTGKWSNKEDDILRSNFKEFVSKYRLKNPSILLGLNVRKQNMKRFIAATHFYPLLAKGLDNRSLVSVYTRARKIFNPYDGGSKNMTEDDMDMFKALYETHGNKFNVISKIMHKDAKFLSDYARSFNKSNVNKGKWSSSETIQLTNSMKEVLKTKDLSKPFKDIDWNEVAKGVLTRNRSQCKNYWMSTLAWDPNGDKSISKPNWTLDDTVKLVNKIHSLCHEEKVKEADLDWDKIVLEFPNQATFVDLRNKWYRLKRSIPDYHSLKFKNITSLLYEQYINV